MATSTLPGPFAPDWTSRATESAAAVRAWDLLRAAGSLKITVVMFLAATFLLFVGTLAQDEKNLPEVKAEYFNSWIARIPFSDFFPVTIFGESRLTGWFPFPGGATIGIVLLANLVAAKVTRFHVSGRGRRLFWGTLVSLLGGLLALAVILTGHRSEGLQGRPPIEYETVWRILQATAAIGTLVLIAAAVRGHSRRLVRLGLAGAAAVAAVSTALMLFGGDDWRMNEPGLRIMWQLMQSSAASLVLLAGLVMVFGHRGGNVLIHLAVGLLMVGQFVFGDRQIEERMTLVEGQSTNMACRIDETELAIATAAEVPPAPAPQTSAGEGRQERVTAISGRLLAARARGEPIRLDDLPFDIHVLDYFANSGLGRGGSGQDGDAANPATAGIGTRVQASARPPEGGASSRTNIASAYIRLVEREGGRDLGTHLVTQFLNDQSQLFMATAADECDTVTSGGREWRMQLRFRREYKPYAVTLDDVRRIDYSASDTPRDYSSYVTFSDPASGEEQKGRIWMNNPVRYRGETFYQSQYSEVDLGGGRKGEQTGLQVVENAGWLVPYVACVLAFWGMLAHFGGTFLRFADRHEREAAESGPEGFPPEPFDAHAAVPVSGVRSIRPGHRPARRPDRPAIVGSGRGREGIRRNGVRTTEGGDRAGWLAPVLAVALVAVCVLPWARPRRVSTTAPDWFAAGSLPAMHEGRIKPLDTVARNTLQLLGNRTTVVMPEGSEGPQGRISATQWLLAAMAGSEWVARAPVFRIDAFEVLDLFDLTRRKGNRYSAAELEKGREALNKQIAAARDVPPEARSFFQKKCGEINQKLMAYDLVRLSYDTPRLPSPPEAGDDEARRAVLDEIRRLLQGARLIEENHPPAVIPPSATIPEEGTDGVAAEAGGPGPASRWQALYPALVTAMVARMVGERPGEAGPTVNPAILPLADLLAAVDGPPSVFNRALVDYRTALDGLPASRDVLGRARFEAWLNAFNPTDLAKWLYVLAMLLCFASFLVWHAPLNRFVTWMLLATLVVHTFAILARISITGRPPVVNLYSSAVFIGWACVLAGLGLESLYRMGIGNLAASLAGALTLMVAYGLDSGDTMHVLQAVLDTQFWLSTHVVTVTLGYGATFLAGLLGTCAIVHRGWVELGRGGSDAEAARAVQARLYRMTYGVVCFALFFSFIGTVLGGLWADDSWGRFWGWDPKENGALMIVLWNAAVLHARWDGWINARGFALFAIGGNIVTAWSWFGTNQLGIGLHSYGFTSGVLMLLAAYVVSQLVLITAGLLLPRRFLAAAPA